MRTSQGWITRAAAARLLHVVPFTIRRWLLNGRLNGRKLGRDWLVDEASVAGLERQRQP